MRRTLQIGCPLGRVRGDGGPAHEDGVGVSGSDDADATYQDLSGGHFLEGRLSIIRPGGRLATRQPDSVRLLGQGGPKTGNMPSLVEINIAARRSDINLTPQAHSLIKLVLESVTEDPHSSWRSSFSSGPATIEELTAQQQKLTSQLPEFLKQIAEAPIIRERVVSTFDVLHWLSGNLDSVCPMKKLPGE